jgi:multidrug efflux pump
LFARLPTAFLPSEDQGVLATQAVLPAGATQERSQLILDQINDWYLNEEKQNVANVLTVNGFGFAGRGQNIGIAFIGLKDWSNREGSENSVDAIAARANQAFSKLIDAQIAAFNLPRLLHWVTQPALTLS